MSSELYTPPVLGRKIARIRNLRGITQETLAKDLGLTRQAISRIEASEEIEDSKLDEIAQALGVTADSIRNFSEDSVINYIQHNYEGSNPNATSVMSNSCTFTNPMEKIIELYEALLKAEHEKIEMLQKYLDKT